MNGRDILNALDMLDQDLVIEAKSVRNRKRHAPGRLLMSAAVIVLAVIMAFSAVAASYGSEWFAGFFSGRSGKPMSQEDMDRIEANTAQIGQSQTRDGYKITLESAFTDGKLAFFRFLLTAPEGTIFDADWYGSRGPCAIVNERGEDLILDREGFYMGGGHFTFIPEEKENELTLLYETETYYTGESTISDSIWTFFIDGLWKGYRDEEVGLRQEQLSDGLWSFEVRFPEGCEREVELIERPVTVLGVLGGAYLEPEYQMDPVAILSCRMRALTVEIYFRSEKRESINADLGEIFAVMKNGDHIPLRRHGTAPNKLNYLFDAPIDLDQVDHLLFHDGTTIPVESGS